MSEKQNKKGFFSTAQIVVLCSLAATIVLVILVSLLLHDPTHASCSPWCFGTCPWCFLIPYVVLLLIFGGILLSMTVVKVVDVVLDALDPGLPDQEEIEKKNRSRAHRSLNIPRQKKHRPRYGHTLRHAKQYDATISLQDLMDAFEDGATVTIELLKSMGLIPVKADGYKVLVGDNESMDRSLTIHATSFSAQARHEILSAGGRAIKVYH